MKLTQLLMAFLLFSNLTFSQCPDTSSIVLSSMAEVVAFKQQYPNCTNVPGNLIIGFDYVVDSSSDISNLEAFDNITSIHGNLVLRKLDELDTTSAFPNLVSIGLYMIMQDNISLTHVTGFDLLSEIGGSLWILKSPELASIEFPSLNTIGRSITIEKTGLRDLHWLGLVNFTSSATIKENQHLTSLQGLNFPNTLSGSIDLDGNDVLTDISQIESVNQISGNLLVQSNSHLVNCSPLCNLITNNAVDGTIFIAGPANSDCMQLEQVIENCITSVTSLSDETTLCQVSPMPCQKGQKVNIEVFKDRIELVTIYNSSGQILNTYKNINASKLSIDTSHFESGMLFIRIFDGNNTFYKRLIIV